MCILQSTSCEVNNMIRERIWEDTLFVYEISLHKTIQKSIKLDVYRL